MPIRADHIISSAAVLLQDEGYDRWVIPELVRWLNDGVRAIVLADPQAGVQPATIPMIAGTLQKIPALISGHAPQSLLYLTHNVTAQNVPGRVVVLTNNLLMSGRNMDWHDATKTPRVDIVRQYALDPADPRSFWVYPGNTGLGSLAGFVSSLPAEIAATGPADLLESYQSPIGLLREIYATPLIDYVCYRAQMKDDVAANAQRAAMHYGSFANALGIKQAQSAAKGAPA